LGREWRSLEGNLFLSVIARLEDKSRWSWIPLTTAVAIVRGIVRRFPELAARVRIKWPNDLWIVPEGAAPGAAGAKLGGILCEAVGKPSGSFIVIGLGLNCARAPEGLDQQALSLSQATGSVLTADEIRPLMIQSLLSALEELAGRGPSVILREYELSAAFPPGARIEWSTSSEVSHGEVLGLGPLGELRVRTEGASEELRLYAEDVRVRSYRTKASDGSPA
jgi:BirA family biotin operon repressor/biotin-[acetyl-CoA-carboxylase] ligase